jgi:hypothetical protein
MFDNVVIDVFIGLIFIFLLYSLLASIIQEIIASRFSLRARMLQKAIRRMLEDHAAPTGNWFQKTTFYNYFGELLENVKRFFKPFRDYEILAKKFYNQPAIKYLGEDKSFSKPAYLQPHNFSYTIVQLLRGPGYDGATQKEAELIKNTLDNNTLSINQETLSQFRNLFADARQDPFEFRARLEQWFDETMQRTQGWYKRQTQTILLFIGFFIAVIFNVDTIAITKILSKDKRAREQMVQLAISKKDNYGSIISAPAIPGSTISAGGANAQGKALDSLYQALSADALASQGIFGLSGSGLHGSASSYQQSKPMMWAGWLITALAISLGAAFWFDLLNKVTALRSTGNRVPSGTITVDSSTEISVGAGSKRIRG